mmetsp:Transcript_40392/g.96006  ORF Transcript_40392/g.96006 Transcript_40392/m.96006 type:complete len:302 (-) Transcript_40392:365-1270(-)
MGHDDDDPRLPDRTCREGLLEPQHAVDGQMVRRLVEQQHVWFGKESSSKSNAHSPPSRQRLHWPGKKSLGEAQADEHAARTRWRVVCVARHQLLHHRAELQGSIASLHAIALGDLFELVLLFHQQLALDVRRQHHINRAHVLMQRRQRQLLCDIVDGHELRQPRSPPRSDPTEQRALSLSVAPDQTIAMPSHEMQPHVLEQVLAASWIGKVERFGLDDAQRAHSLTCQPRSRCAAACLGQLGFHGKLFFRCLLCRLFTLLGFLRFQTRLGHRGFAVHVGFIVLSIAAKGGPSPSLQLRVHQ